MRHEVCRMTHLCLKKQAVLLVLLITLPFSFSQEHEDIYQQLLSYRINHSDTYKQIQNETKIIENNYTQKILGSYLQLNMGLGNLGLTVTDHGVDYNLNPTVSINLPSFSNMQFGFSFPIQKGNMGTTSNFNFSFGIDIYSQSIRMQRLQREIALRQKNEALQRLNNSLDIIRQEFLTEVKSILNAYLDYLGKQLAEVEADIEFRRLQIEGYGENTIKYKAGSLKSLSAKRNAETTKKIFINQVKKFLFNVGLTEADFGNTEDELLDGLYDFFYDLSLSIPEEQVISQEKINLEYFTEYIKACQNYSDTLAQRKIQNSIFTLTGSVQLNTPIKGSSATSMGGGLAFSFPGVSLSAGVSLDFSAIKYPSFTFGLQINPLDIVYRVLNDKNMRLQNEIDEINFKSTKEKYESQIFDLQSKAENIVLTNEAALYEYEIYSQNAKDVRKLYNDGIVSNLDNRQATVQELQALVRYAQSKADISIFNIEIQNSFLLQE